MTRPLLALVTVLCLVGCGASGGETAIDRTSTTTALADREPASTTVARSRTTTTTPTTTSTLPAPAPATSTPPTAPPTIPTDPYEPYDPGVEEPTIPCPTGQVDVGMHVWATHEQVEGGVVVIHTTHGSARITNRTGHPITSIQGSADGSSYWSFGYYETLRPNQTVTVEDLGGDVYDSAVEPTVDLSTADGFATFDEYELTGCEVNIKFAPWDG